MGISRGTEDMDPANSSLSVKQGLLWVAMSVVILVIFVLACNNSIYSKDNAFKRYLLPMHYFMLLSHMQYQRVFFIPIIIPLTSLKLANPFNIICMTGT